LWGPGKKTEVGKIRRCEVKKMKKNYKPNGIHAFMHPCNIIPTQLFFPSSYLLSFPSSLFPPWPPEAKKVLALEEFV
jgi:hypothetical protein